MRSILSLILLPALLVTACSPRPYHGKGPPQSTSTLNAAGNDPGASNAAPALPTVAGATGPTGPTINAPAAAADTLAAGIDALELDVDADQVSFTFGTQSGTQAGSYGPFTASLSAAAAAGGVAMHAPSESTGIRAQLECAKPGCAEGKLTLRKPEGPLAGEATVRIRRGMAGVYNLTKPPQLEGTHRSFADTLNRQGNVAQTHLTLLEVPGGVTAYRADYHVQGEETRTAVAGLLGIHVMTKLYFSQAADGSAFGASDPSPDAVATYDESAHRLHIAMPLQDHRISAIDFSGGSF